MAININEVKEATVKYIQTLDRSEIRNQFKEGGNLNKLMNEFKKSTFNANNKMDKEFFHQLEILAGDVKKDVYYTSKRANDAKATFIKNVEGNNKRPNLLSKLARRVKDFTNKKQAANNFSTLLSDVVKSNESKGIRSTPPQQNNTKENRKAVVDAAPMQPKFKSAVVPQNKRNAVIGIKPIQPKQQMFDKAVVPQNKRHAMKIGDRTPLDMTLASAPTAPAINTKSKADIPPPPPPPPLPSEKVNTTAAAPQSRNSSSPPPPPPPMQNPNVGSKQMGGREDLNNAIQNGTKLKPTPKATVTTEPSILADIRKGKELKRVDLKQVEKDRQEQRSQQDPVSGLEQSMAKVIEQKFNKGKDNIKTDVKVERGKWDDDIDYTNSKKPVVKTVPLENDVKIQAPSEASKNNVTQTSEPLKPESKQPIAQVKPVIKFDDNGVPIPPPPPGDSINQPKQNAVLPKKDNKITIEMAKEANLIPFHKDEFKYIPTQDDYKAKIQKTSIAKDGGKSMIQELNKLESKDQLNKFYTATIENNTKIMEIMLKKGSKEVFTTENVQKVADAASKIILVNNPEKNQKIKEGISNLVEIAQEQKRAVKSPEKADPNKSRGASQSKKIETGKSR